MPGNRQWRWIIPCAGAPIGAAQAAIDGSLVSNVAALLLVLGMGAVLMGLRNLRQLRHQRITPARSAKSCRQSRS